MRLVRCLGWLERNIRMDPLLQGVPQLLSLDGLSQCSKCGLELCDRGRQVFEPATCACLFLQQPPAFNWRDKSWVCSSLVYIKKGKILFLFMVIVRKSLKWSWLFTCRCGRGDILQDRKEHTIAEATFRWPGASFPGQVENSVGLEKSGDQQLYHTTHLSLDPGTWTIHKCWGSSRRLQCVCVHWGITTYCQNTMLWLIEKLMDGGFSSQ